MNRAHEIVVDPGPERPEVRPGVASWYAPGLSDGLGDRLLMFDNTGASSLELLRFKKEFGHRPVFEEALRERIAQLERFSHPSVATVRSLDWLRAGEELALVSNHTPGRRLSEAMTEARGPSFAIELIRQIAPILAALQQHGQHVAHGALTPERIIITPDGRLVVVEHVLGSAIESLDLPASRLRSEFGIAAMPVDGGRSALDRRADVVQLGLIALSLLIGRRIDPNDHPAKVSALLDEFPWTSPRGGAPTLRDWLERALQLGGGTFASAQEACDALDEWHEERRLGQEPRTLQAVPTPMPDDSFDEFLSEDEINFKALQAAHPPAPSKASAAAAPAPAMPLELPDEPRATFTPPARAGGGKTATAAAPAKAPAAAPKTAPREQSGEAFAQKRRPRVRIAPWIAGAFAIVALAEGAVIGRLVFQGFSLRAILTGRATPPSATPPAADTSAGRTEPLRTDAASGVPGTPASGAAPGSLAAAGTAPSPLEVTSEPPGARVTVDGTAHGVTPITVPVAPGPHAVTISDGTTTTKRNVTAIAGVSLTLMASFAPGAAPAGWVTIKSALDLQVREGGSLLGVTSVERLMLPAGRHSLEISSAPLGFQTTIPVDIQPGKTIIASVAIPNGSLSLNALPWANVTLDGTALTGTTPFANLEVALGPHEIVWKHPQLGERRETVVITAKAPVRRVLDWKAPIK